MRDARRARAGLAALAFLAFVAAAAARTAPGIANVEAAFTPGDDIAGLIAQRIARSRRSVQVQAYLFTDRKLAHALLAALRRGVAVEIVGDAAQQEAGGLPWLAALERAGARVFLDRRHAASHNKIVIVDGATAGATVITGSYNFTPAAQSKNAENVVVITGERALTERFVRNFEYHRGESTPWP
jgi:phosphatidylserine/phosphatidylglycerophosphate/cardiolipin synthase-like enzyme